MIYGNKMLGMCIYIYMYAYVYICVYTYTNVSNIKKGTQHIMAFFVSFKLGWLDSKAHHKLSSTTSFHASSSPVKQRHRGPCLSRTRLYLQNSVHHLVHGKQSVDPPSSSIFCFIIVSHFKTVVHGVTGILRRCLRYTFGEANSGRKKPTSLPWS